VRSGDGARECVGKCLVDFAGRSIECTRLVEAKHLDRPLDRCALAADCQSAVGFPGDGDDAPVDVRRIGSIDGKLGLAGRPALGERRIIEKGEAHRALDLERAITGEKHRGRVGVDALDTRAAMGRGTAEKSQHFALLVRIIVQAGAPILLGSSMLYGAT
jgi:hypothetical protein